MKIDITFNDYYIVIGTIEFPSIIEYTFSKFWDIENLLFKEMEIIKSQYEY